MGRCGSINGPNSPDKMFSGILKVVQLMTKGVTRGPGKVLPPEQSGGGMHG